MCVRSYKYVPYSSDHWRRWRSKPGSRIVGSTTKVELTTVATDLWHQLSATPSTVVCVVPGKVKEGKRRHHIMAYHGDIQPTLSTCLWQLCVAELVVQYLCLTAKKTDKLLTRQSVWPVWTPPASVSHACDARSCAGSSPQSAFSVVRRHPRSSAFGTVTVLPRSVRGAGHVTRTTARTTLCHSCPPST